MEQKCEKNESKASNDTYFPKASNDTYFPNCFIFSHLICGWWVTLSDYSDGGILFL